MALADTTPSLSPTCHACTGRCTWRATPRAEALATAARAWRNEHTMQQRVYDKPALRRAFTCDMRSAPRRVAQAPSLEWLGPRTTCELLQLDAGQQELAAAWCKFRLSVLFIGDSISLQHHMALAALLDAQPVANVSSHYGACGGTSRLGFLRSERLAPAEWAHEATEAAALDAFDAIVINSGAHWVADEADYMARVDTTLTLLEARARPGTYIAFRSTVPGHSGCDNATAPWTSLAEAQRRTEREPWCLATPGLQTTAASSEERLRSNLARLLARADPSVRHDPTRPGCTHRAPPPALDP